MRYLLDGGAAVKRQGLSERRLMTAAELLSLTPKENSLVGRLPLATLPESKKPREKKRLLSSIIPMVTLTRNSARLANGCYASTEWQCKPDGSGKGYILRFSTMKRTIRKAPTGLTTPCCKSSHRIARKS